MGPVVVTDSAELAARLVAGGAGVVLVVAPGREVPVEPTVRGWLACFVADVGERRTRDAVAMAAELRGGGVGGTRV